MPRVLMLYMEPAPYVTVLVAAIRQIWPGSVDAYYIKANATQNWGAVPVSAEHFLPHGVMRSCRFLFSVLRKDNYDLAHISGWGHPLLLFAIFLAACRRIPIAVQSDTPEGQHRSGIRRALKKVIYPWLFSLPTHFLPFGTRQARNFKTYGVREDRISVMQMTVDVKAISRYVEEVSSEKKTILRRQMGVHDDLPLVLYLGRLESFKGINSLLDAFDVLDACPARLCIAGSGALEADIVERAQTSPFIHFVGHLQNEKVWQAYAIADVLVLPSLFEPWGLVVNEAMASGVPVIVSERVGCVDDLVEHGKTGLIVPAGNILILKDALKTLLMDGNLRREMGSAGKRRILNWTMENAAQRTAAAWRKALP